MLSSALIDGRASPFVRRLLRDTSVDATIHPRDEMLLHPLRQGDWDFALVSYFQRGLEARALHAQIVECFFEGRRDIDVLDFASGFGRATRFLVEEHSSSRVWAADIQDEAMDFQRRQFGVGALRSSVEPEELNPGRRFNLVVAHSFFSHVSPARFVPWLARLNQLIEDRGALVFSVHDHSLGPPASRDAADITFTESSETDRLDSTEYGTTWVSEAYVRDAVGQSCAGKRVLRVPRGLGNYQDVYVVRQSDAGERSPTFDQGPCGYVGISRMFGHDLDLIGWVSHWNPERRAQSIIVELNGAVMCQLDSFFDRKDVVEHLGHERHLHSGWHVRFPLPDAASQMADVLAIRAISDRGAETLLYVGTVAGLLLQSCREELTAAGRLQAVFPDPGSQDPLEAYLQPARSSAAPGTD